MAAKKKKTRAGSNPARGFSTVSVTSRSKINDQENQDVVDAPQVINQNASHAAPQALPQDQPNVEQDRQLQDLSPEELEFHLEEAELQSYVNARGPAVKKSSSRAAAKLDTERRQLRPQAATLDHLDWLRHDDVDKILGLYREETERPVANVSRNLSKEVPSQDDICQSLWGLQLTLQNLNFDDDQTNSVLAGVARRYAIAATVTEYEVRDQRWALENAFDWMAAHFAEEQLLSYERKKSSPSGNWDGEVSDADLRRGVPISASTSRITTHDGWDEPSLRPSDGGYVLNREASPLESADESASDIEPEALIEEFISTNSQLYEAKPELFDLKTSELRSNLHDLPSADLGSPSPEARSIRKLTHKLKKIEGDVLFDRREAVWHWKSRMNAMAQMRGDLKRVSAAKTQPKISRSSDSPDEERPSTPAEDDGGLFVAMFAAQGDAIASNDRADSDAESTIIIRDFGKWTGANPRRILEEACKARDPGSRLFYKPISSSNFSSRHTLQIKWSRDQTTSESVPTITIDFSSAPRLTTLAMRKIATSSLVQSESYISTAALFLIFSSSSKEEKCYLRLPTTWRSLWFEFLDLKSAYHDAQDKQLLKEIRRLMPPRKAQLDSEAPTPKSTNEIPEANANDVDTVERLVPAPDSDPTAIKMTWRRKISSVAYEKMLRFRSTLPIWNFKQEILNSLNQHQALIICGETGCGKSTQIPSFILEQEMASGRECKIFVTEPRRISAISLARRVSEELGEWTNDIGTRRSEVGFAIRLESRLNESTRLIYATTGIVVRMLERPRELQKVTHLLLDEVHERSIDGDFLLIVVKRLMAQRPELKVVLMSATLDADRFSKYLGGAPIFSIPGRTFPIEVKYLEDVIDMVSYSPESKQGEGEIEPDESELDEEVRKNEEVEMSNTGYSEYSQRILSNYNEYRINYGLITMVLHRLATDSQLEQYSRAILVFLPGMFEIRRLSDAILSHPSFQSGWIVHALHSSVASEEQEQAFVTPPAGVRKIVLATNIAETGITIPDITAVVDSGKEKVMRFDERRQLSRLVESFISRANAKQRRGRAGRVQSGICFHLFSKTRHDKLVIQSSSGIQGDLLTAAKLNEQQTPEILRLSLQDLVLRVKICNLGGIEETLSEALDPPSARNIRRAIESLKDVKALTHLEELTPLGRQLARLPLDVFLGKLILNGIFFRCLDSSVTIAAIMSSKSPFKETVGSRAQLDLAKSFFRRGDSDLITLYNAYLAWRRVRTSSNLPELQFCRKNCLSPQALSGIEDLKVSLYIALVEAGLLRLDSDHQAQLRRARFTNRGRYFFSPPLVLDMNSSHDIILNSIIAWSFYPKLLVRDGQGWKNIANNQSISVPPSSVNKRADNQVKWLSFYNIMQGGNKKYNANETSAVEELAIVLLCGDADFKVYPGIISIDGSRIRLAVRDMRSMLALKVLSLKLREMLTKFFRNPGKNLSLRDLQWFDVWQDIFSRRSTEAK